MEEINNRRNKSARFNSLGMWRCVLCCGVRFVQLPVFWWHCDSLWYLETQLHIPEPWDPRQHRYKKIQVSESDCFCRICLTQHTETNHFTSCFTKTIRKGKRSESVQSWSDIVRPCYVTTYLESFGKSARCCQHDRWPAIAQIQICSVASAVN